MRRAPALTLDLADVALPLEQMIEIDVAAGTQPCDKFGVHYKLPTVAQLYQDGQAAFVSNIGNLIEPTNRAAYLDKSVSLPPQNFAVRRMSRTSQWGEQLAF